MADCKSLARYDEALHSGTRRKIAEAEAIQMANDSDYGLMAYVSSTSADRANRVARQLQAGRVLINTLAHDPLTPFGGFKQSGVGREGGDLRTARVSGT